MNVLAFSYSFPSQLKIALHFIMIKLVVCAMQSFAIGFEVINPSKSDSFLIRMSFLSTVCYVQLHNLYLVKMITKAGFTSINYITFLGTTALKGHTILSWK